MHEQAPKRTILRRGAEKRNPSRMKAFFIFCVCGKRNIYAFNIILPQL